MTLFNLGRTALAAACATAIGLAAFALAAPAGASAATLPYGFYEEPVYLGLEAPVGLAFSPTGRAYVSEKAGLVWAVETDGSRSATPVLDLTGEVNGQGDRGLLGLALDPAFTRNRYLYLLYAVDPVPGSPDEPADQVTWSRLTRYTLTKDGLSVQASSRLVLLGNTAATGFPACYTTHTIGTLAFASDGSLFVGAGDGAHYDYWADYGQDKSAFDPACQALFGADQDIGAFRAQSLDSLAGKIVRIDPRNGLGVKSNPYFNGSGQDLSSRVFASGLRNPWRFTVRASTGAVWIGDVGEGRWEEINVARGGENFGWPCFEGSTANEQYFDAQPFSSGCDTLESPPNPGPLTAASLAWHHDDATRFTPAELYPGGFTGSTALAGVFYTGRRYPKTWQGRLFMADFTEGWIRAISARPLDEQPTAIDDFAAGLPGIVDIKANPANGDLYYLNIYTGELVHLAYAQGANRPPVAVIAANPTYGSVPLPVQFSSAGSSDPDGDALTYRWDFGDGGTGSGATPLHTYTTAGRYTAILTVSDPSGATSSASIILRPGDTPPQATIVAPRDLARFDVPGVISFSASAIDAESTQAQLSYQWHINLHHEEHVHPDYAVLTGAQASLAVSSLDENCYLEVQLQVTDPQGLRDEEVIKIYPSNLAPVFTTASQQTAQVGRPLELPITAIDPDGDEVRFEALELPPGASFGSNNLLRWTPGDDQLGVATARFQAIDVDPAPMTSELEVSIQVLPAEGELVTVTLTSDWGTGFCADLTWTNDTGMVVDGWSMDLPLEGDVYVFWSGLFEPVEGGYLITPEWYNGTVDPGAGLLVGFCATATDRPGPVILHF